MSKRLIFDIETDGLLQDVTKIHCICTIDADTGHAVSYTQDTLAVGLYELIHADVLIGHNIQGYDIPVLNKLTGFTTKALIRDTLLMSRLVWSDIFENDIRHRQKHPDYPGNLMGNHSLEAWGHRLGVLKGTYGKTTDWKDFTPEMLAYCQQDVVVTHELWKKIEAKQYSEQAIQLEHDFAEVIQAQERHGFLFDKEKAVALYTVLSKKRLELEDELKKVFPGWYYETKTPEYYQLKQGDQELGKYPTKGAADAARKDKKLKPKDVTIEVGPLAKKHVPFNPASRDHVAKALTEQYGWKPLDFTDNGKPKVDETTLEALVYPEAKLLVEYFTIEKRIGQIAEGDQAWLKLERKGRIHGRVTTNGAVTGRCTHSNPNMAQVPAVGAPYGAECRELFKVKEGYKLVGCDASGLELRCLAHYMAKYDGGAYGKELLEGDIHTANQKAAGLPTRAMAKTFIYGYLYGAGDAKIGLIVNGTAKDGKRLKDSFLAKTPALKRLKEDVSHVVKTRGYLIGLDGRHLNIRSEHAALNTLLQSAGALVVKQGTVLLHKRLLSLGWVFGKEWAQVAHIHDEIQSEVREDLVNEYGQLAVESLREAGRLFNFRCPIDGEWKQGNNWKETH